MSKGDSHLFTRTSGEGRALIDEVIANGEIISPEKVVMITRDPSGKIVWLETGNDASGLQGFSTLSKSMGPNSTGRVFQTKTFQTTF